MSVFIPGMEMPKRCSQCDFYLWNGDDDYSCLLYGESEPCGLVEIKTPHGRMIDADASINTLMKCAMNPKEEDANAKWFYLFAAKILENCPTIIEAEGGGEDG